LAQLEEVRDIEEPDVARSRGNEHFKAGNYPSALAHYERGIELLKAEEQVPAAALATLLSNSAMSLLKLQWPDRAKKCASMAIAAVRHADDSAFDQSKLYYRRALACEQLREMSQAVDDMAQALQQAKQRNLPPAEQHRLKGEVDRLQRLKKRDGEYKAKKNIQAENERTAEVERVQGDTLRPKEVSAKHNVVSETYLAESDLSHWTLGEVREAVRGICHNGQSGCRIEIKELDEKHSKVEASITTKKGKRALYYDMDLHVRWKGTAASKLKPKDGSGELQGMIRVYNIGHDTKFELGGDENTSYIYALGWDQRMKGDWISDLTTEAAELFDLIAVQVDEVVKKLRQK